VGRPKGNKTTRLGGQRTENQNNAKGGGGFWGVKGNFDGKISTPKRGVVVINRRRLPQNHGPREKKGGVQHKDL